MLVRGLVVVHASRRAELRGVYHCSFKKYFGRYSETLAWP